MKRIMIIGADGQLGHSLMRLMSSRTDMKTLFTTKDTLDITNRDAVERAVSDFSPELIINTAAYTAVDKAEQESQEAAAVNAIAPGYIAQAALNCKAKLIHISTDYVFAGDKTTPYTERDTPAPQTVYGLTKLQGEQAVSDILNKHSVILRTAWLYSPFGHNFVNTMLTLAADREEISVVADQWGCPTYAPVLAQAIIAVIDSTNWIPGIYHLAGSGRTTWFDFTKAIFETAGITRCRVRPITSAEYPTAARRPAYSVLDSSLFSRTFNFEIPHWKQSLASFFKELG